MNVERFLIQVRQNLPEHEGVTTWVENSALNVGYGKTESFEIRYPGGICYNAATEKTDEFYKLVEEADKAFKTVKEYIDLMDNAPELSARDFNMPYKLLAEFNGVVLGGIEHRSNNTFEFTTWSYANNSLYHDHYFTDYEKAKEDFAVYEDLTKAGIALEFLIEGPVDDNFIEAYSFVLTRNSIWHIKRIRNIISPLDRNALLKAECINPSTDVRSYNYKKIE